MLASDKREFLFGCWWMFRRLGISEAELLEDYPTLRAADLANAWAYAEAYSDEIEIAIREQEEA